MCVYVQEKWAFATGGYIVSSAAVDKDGTVYVGSYDNKIYAINPDGTERWEFVTDGAIVSSPALAADRTIYVGSDDGKLYALRTEDGKLRWSFNTGIRVCSSPVIGRDGTIYVGAGDHNLYAIKGSAPLARGPWPMYRQNPRHTGRAADVRAPHFERSL